MRPPALVRSTLTALAALAAVGAGATRTAAQDPIPAGRPDAGQSAGGRPDGPLPPGASSRAPLRADSSGARAIAAARSRGTRAVVRDLGPGPAGRIVRSVLTGPHLLVVAPDSGLVLGRDVRIDRPLVVVGRAHVASTVQGDLVVLGELYLRPGALVDGRAVAVGGGVHPSTLALVRGGTFAYREVAFDATPLAGGTLALDARRAERTVVSSITLPGPLGFRLPGYDRIDGLVLAAGPEIALDTGRVRIEPTLAYRSHLGAVDPALRARAELGERTALELDVARGTFTNEAWIRSDIVNSAIALFAGVDVRNYWRADRAEVLALRRWDTERVVLTPFVGALVERSWSAARAPGATSVPFSLLGRDDPERMRRPNPPVTGGRIASALGGLRWQAALGEGVEVAAIARVEQALAAQRTGRFTQATLDGEVAFPAFRDHRFEAFAHAVLSAGDSVPSQRWAWLGGQGTLQTLPLLAQGGDRLVYVESRYTIPIGRVQLPYLGVPLVTLRHAVGGAGVGRLPALTQNLGLRLTLGGLRVDYTIDPKRPGDGRFNFGVGLLR